MTDPSLLLPAAHHLQATAWTQGLVEMTGQIDAMEGQEIQSLAPQSLKGEGQHLFELVGVIPRWDLALQDAI